MLKILAAALLLAFPAFSPSVQAQENSPVEPFSPDQLDNLLAYIALYPDPLLAQILPAATFPDQVDEAARFCRADANPDDIDIQPWDVSIKAIAHYPSVLNMMADNLDWTTAVGQAYVNQSEDVMASIQRLRQEARNAGNLVTTPQEEVDADDGNIEIWPAQPDECYVPVYDPGLVFFGSGGLYGGTVISFGGPVPIGVWLNRGIDWRHRRIYYHGWAEGRGWVARARPYVHVNNPVYVNKNLKNTTVNRDVTARAVNYGSLARYSSVHRSAGFTGAKRRDEPEGTAGDGSTNENKIIERNGVKSNALLNLFRGRSEAPRQAEPADNSAFGVSRGSFGTKASSERGQASRASRPAPAPAPRSSGGGGGGGSHGGGGGGGGSHGGGGGGGKH